MSKTNIPVIIRRFRRSYPSIIFVVALTLVLYSCSSKTEPYSFPEFKGTVEVNNYSKSMLLMENKSDSLNPTVVPGGRGDLFVCNENFFMYGGKTAQNSFLFETNGSVVNVNNKIISLNIPGDDGMIPWFEKMKEKDFSSLQALSFKSKISEIYLPYLTELARIKPNAGLSFTGDFVEMAPLFKIFNPAIITGPSIAKSDFEQLSKLTNLEILMVSFKDSIINDPLPTMPELEQLFLTDIKSNTSITNDFLINNRQIERVIIQKEGSLDFSILKPLFNLKELVVNVSDTILNFDSINDHSKLEVLSVAGDNLVYNMNKVRLPGLRWIAFPPNVTQEEFNTFIGNHPDLEIVEIIRNDTISNLQPLTKSGKLSGLVITDTVTDLASIKTLRNLKYLSLPVDFLKDTIRKADLQKSLPGARIVGNEGFCLGSGWLVVLIPIVLIFSLFGWKKKQRLQGKAGY